MRRQRPSSRPRRTAVLAVTLLLHLSIVTVDAKPFLLLNNPRPKCVEVKATEETSVIVDYEAPDLVTLDGLDEDGASDETPPGLEKAVAAAADDKKGPDEARKDAADKKKQGQDAGLDKMWKDKQEAKREQMRKINKREQMRKLKGKAITDMTISIIEKGDTVNQARNRFQRAKKKPLNNMRKEIEDKKGTVSLVASRDGTVEICVQSLSASHSLPSLVHISVREDLEQKRELEKEKSDKRHMNNMESTLRSLIRRMAMIQKTADYAKEQEYEFHETTIAMNKAIKIWPILHCIMLLVTGATMARHMTAYLKGHHIY